MFGLIILASIILYLAIAYCSSLLFIWMDGRAWSDVPMRSDDVGFSIFAGVFWPIGLPCAAIGLGWKKLAKRGMNNPWKVFHDRGRELGRKEASKS